jgi:hypothetical protein
MTRLPGVPFVAVLACGVSVMLTPVAPDVLACDMPGPVAEDEYAMVPVVAVNAASPFWKPSTPHELAPPFAMPRSPVHSMAPTADVVAFVIEIAGAVPPDETMGGVPVTPVTVPEPPEPVQVTAPVVGEHETVPAPVTDETPVALTVIDSLPVVPLYEHVAPVQDTVLTNVLIWSSAACAVPAS